MIFKQGLKRIVILKARQLGFSTLLGVICTDQLCWTTGKQTLAHRSHAGERPAEAARHRRPGIRLPARRTQGAIHCEPVKRRRVWRALPRIRCRRRRARFSPARTPAAERTRSFGLASGDTSNAKTCGASRGDPDRRAPERERRDHRCGDDMARRTRRTSLGHRQEGARNARRAEATR